MKPFFCFYGGKWRAAPHYPAPKHDVIVEPFAGAAGYATRYADRKVRLYDKDPVIVGIWKYLIGVTAAEILRLPLDITNVDDIKGPQEARHLVGFWLNKGAASPCKTPSRWMRDNARPDSYWGSVIRNRLAEQVSKVKHWKVYNKEYDCIAFDNDATFFIDPPYQQAGNHYKYGAKDIDYEKLSRWCRSRHGQIIVCENAGATWLPFTPFRIIKGSPGAGRSGQSKEVIYARDLP